MTEGKLMATYPTTTDNSARPEDGAQDVSQDADVEYTDDDDG